MPKDEFDHFRKILGDEEGLALLLRGLKEFDEDFQSAIRRGDQFTIKLEVHGNRGKLIHCRSSNDALSRVEKRKSRETADTA